jgi:hypothetical protein
MMHALGLRILPLRSIVSREYQLYKGIFSDA